MNAVLSKEKLDEIGDRLGDTPLTSLRLLVQDISIWKLSTAKEMNLLKLLPYKATAVLL
jgi:hypothetical protein